MIPHTHTHTHIGNHYKFNLNTKVSNFTPILKCFNNFKSKAHTNFHFQQRDCRKSKNPRPNSQTKDIKPIKILRIHFPLSKFKLLK